jgi:hypothetical protein
MPFVPQPPRAKQPLAEVFGFPAHNLTPEAERHRRHRLCPFNNNIPNCTKDKAQDPLGVCSVYDGGTPVITCPVRFRQGWHIAAEAAAFFFPPGSHWTSLVEVGIKDGDGRAAGNVDVVLVRYDEQGQVIDFGALEVQAVYISGNVRKPFEHYMANRTGEFDMDWSRMQHYPQPDYLSSSRKRLAPQLLYKGAIFNAWGKKQAVVVQPGFFATLPKLPLAVEERADMAWLLYDLDYDRVQQCFSLILRDRVLTQFEPALARISKPMVGPVDEFVERLQARLDAKLSAAPIAPTIVDEISTYDDDSQEALE